jgi:hypothetical protein
VTLSLSSSAEEPTSEDKALAAQLFQEGEKLMAAGDASAACPKYGESERRDPQLGTLLQLAACQEKIGKTASAWICYKDAAELAARRNAAGTTEAREQVARARAAALESNVSTLSVVVAQTDGASLDIRKDGELVDHAAWGSAWPLDPGKYTITAQAKGKKPFVKVVEVTTGAAKIEVTIPPLEYGEATATPASTAATTGTATTPTAGTPPALPERSTKGDQQRMLGYVAGGIGVVSVGIGVVFGLRVNTLEEQRDAVCPSGLRCTMAEAQYIAHLNDDARANAVACNVAVLLGAAAVAGGAALVLTAPSGRSPISAAAPGLRIGPWGGLNAAGASVQGHF